MKYFPNTLRWLLFTHSRNDLSISRKEEMGGFPIWIMSSSEQIRFMNRDV